MQYSKVIGAWFYVSLRKERVVFSIPSRIDKSRWFLSGGSTPVNWMHGSFSQALVHHRDGAKSVEVKFNSLENRIYYRFWEAVIRAFIEPVCIDTRLYSTVRTVPRGIFVTVHFLQRGLRGRRTNSLASSTFSRLYKIHVPSFKIHIGTGRFDGVLLPWIKGMFENDLQQHWYHALLRPLY